MSFYKSAINLAAMGFHVFPLVPNSKLPAIDAYPELATTDPEQIRKWWFDPVMEIEQPYNVGISTTRFGRMIDVQGALIVVDVDNKNEKRGDDEILRLELEGFDFPLTFEQKTPTGGRHLVYYSPTPVKQGVSVLGPGLDIRSKGGYIVGAGSVINGKPYVGNGEPIAPCPQWIIDKCGEAPEKKAQTMTATEIVNRSTNLRRAIEYLQKEAPLAVKGQGGDQVTYRVAARVKDFGVDANTCHMLMLTQWNDRTTPGWSPERLKEKVDHAYKYGNEPIGVASPEYEFKDVEVDPPPPPPPDEEELYLREMNQKYAIVYNEGGHSILEETVDEKGRAKRNFFSELTFKRKFSTQIVQYGGKSHTWAEAWLDWPGRREYQGLCFAPEREPRNGYYNLWSGFAVEPIAPAMATASARRGFEMFLQHAKDNVCQGDETLFNWLMGYFAHLVQHPGERPLTTLVFKGRKGTGKNAIVERVGKLLGDRQFLVAHNSRYLTSNFNGHLDSCLCLVLDEAFWSGDKSAEGALKGITTSPEIMIERKGRDPYTVDNLVRCVIIGNEDWLVPATQDERRYAVFQMGEGRMQDTKFFEEMRVLMDNEGGNQILLHYLKTFDLSTMDVNIAPKTEALHEQKLMSLEPFFQFWHECITDGRISGVEFEGNWPEQVDKTLFRNAFARYVRDRQIRSRVPDARVLGKELRKVLPHVVTDQKRRDGESFVKVYRLPPLSECRKARDHYIGHESKWDEENPPSLVADPFS